MKKTKPKLKRRPTKKQPASFKNRPVITDETFPEDGMRLNKYIAKCGICSRRKAAELLAQGLFTVNDTLVKEVGFRVQESDVVTYKGKPIEIETNKVYLLLNKPKNTITTAHDPQGRRTALDLVDKACKERIFPVGRLDRNTTGLLLLTNDGTLAKKLAHPSGNVIKVYHTVLDKEFAEEDMQKLLAGLTLEDGPVEVDSASYVKGKSKKEVGVELHIGRNRIVRRIFEHLGYKVIKLDRVYFAGLTKKDLPRGRYRFLTERDIIMLKHFV